MKHRDQMSEKELLIRLDERMEALQGHLPNLWKAIRRHDRELLIAKVLFAVLLVAVSIKYPIIADALARAFG